MKALANQIRKNNFDYYLHKRQYDVASYLQYEGESLVACEVFVVKTMGEAVINGNYIEGGEKYPSNEDFGKTAFVYRNFDEQKMFERADKKFKELLNRKGKENEQP